jgi:hypothetical protein
MLISQKGIRSKFTVFLCQAFFFVLGDGLKIKYHSSQLVQQRKIERRFKPVRSKMLGVCVVGPELRVFKLVRTWGHIHRILSTRGQQSYK